MTFPNQSLPCQINIGDDKNLVAHDVHQVYITVLLCQISHGHVIESEYVQ